MARRSLKPHLNQIRAWVRQGRTDAWIAHQLEVTVQQIESFKRDNELAPDDGEAGGNGFGEEIDLRAEDDALVAAELEAAAEAEADGDDDEEADDEDEDEDEERPKRRRRGRRGGEAAGRGRLTWRARSTTARRATGCGSIRQSRTTPSTPSTGPATAPSS